MRKPTETLPKQLHAWSHLTVIWKPLQQWRKYYEFTNNLIIIIIIIISSSSSSSSSSSNSNWTEWRTIQGVIGRVISEMIWNYEPDYSLNCTTWSAITN